VFLIDVGMSRGIDEDGDGYSHGALLRIRRTGQEESATALYPDGTRRQALAGAIDRRWKCAACSIRPDRRGPRAFFCQTERNLLVIRDRRVAVSYVVEAVRIFDHCHFRVAQADAKKGEEETATGQAPRGRPVSAPWWARGLDQPRGKSSTASCLRDRPRPDLPNSSVPLSKFRSAFCTSSQNSASRSSRSIWKISRQVASTVFGRHSA